MASDPRCHNQAFNITNTDVFRWNHLWPKIAEVFGMSPGSIRPLKLADVMSKRHDIWTTICRKHKLKPFRLEEVANWSYADGTMERNWDEILSHNKSLRYGFNDWDESEVRFVRILKQYQHTCILPC